MKAAITNAEKEVTKLKKDGGHTGAGGQPQYNESQKLIYELYFKNKPNETTTVLYKDLNNKTSKTTTAQCRIFRFCSEEPFSQNLHLCGFYLYEFAFKYK